MSRFVSRRIVFVLCSLLTLGLLASGCGDDDGGGGSGEGGSTIAGGGAASPAAEGASAVARTRAETVRRFVQGDLASLRVVLGLAVIWVIFQSQNDRFLSAENLTNLMLQITAVGLISIGVVYVLLLGEIDLSVGAVSGLAAAVVAVLNVKHGWNPYLAIAAGVMVGTAIGLLQGALFSRFGVPSFVVTRWSPRWPSSSSRFSTPTAACP